MFFNLVANSIMITKAKLKEQIENFPESFSLDELIERLILIEKIEIGKQQSSNNEVVNERDVDEEIKKWFK
jgi:hypothetical protein